MDTKQSIASIRSFDKSDWYAFAGAERFVDEAEPLIWEGTWEAADITCIADANGVHIYTYDNEAETEEDKMNSEVIYAKDMEKYTKEQITHALEEVVKVIVNADDLHCEVLEQGFKVIKF